MPITTTDRHTAFPHKVCQPLFLGVLRGKPVGTAPLRGKIWVTKNGTSVDQKGQPRAGSPGRPFSEAFLVQRARSEACRGCFWGYRRERFSERFALMKLTEKKIRGLRPQQKPFKTFDGGGLFLLVTPTGSKLWRYKFRFGGRERLLALGKYPDLTLIEARRLHLKARSLLAQGIDPAEEKKRDKEHRRQASQNTLECLSNEWIAIHSKRVVPERARALLRALQRHCLPFLGHRSIQSLKTPMLLEWLQRLEHKTGTATVHLCKSALKMVLDLAVAKGIIELNPLENGRISHQLAPRRICHHPAPERPETVGMILRAIDALPDRWSIQMRAALRLLPLIATRPAEMLHMKWEEVDWENREWRFIASKTNTSMIVPLARQSMAILRELWAHTGNETYVFSGPRSNGKPIDSKGFPTAMSKIPGIPPGAIVPHGWRSVFSTLGQEECGFTLAWIEMQLGHKVRGPLGDTYNRARFLEQRRKMMQQWANYLDKLRSIGGASGGITLLQKAIEQQMEPPT